MANDTAKEQFQQAQDLCKREQFAEAWKVLEELYREVPNSRRLAYQRGLCLLGLERYDEALSCCKSLEGKMEESYVRALQNKITSARRASGDNEHFATPTAVGDDAQLLEPMGLTVDVATPPPQETPAPPLAQLSEEAANIFAIDSVFPTSMDETTVTGRVVEGAFYTGDSVSLVSPSGLPLLAPIIRIGTAETPLKMVREGQQAVMVLKVEPHHVVPGSRATSSSSSDSHKETVVVSGDSNSPGVQEVKTKAELDSELKEVEGMIAERRVREAHQKLTDYLAAQPSSCDAHRLLARVYLENNRELRDKKKALQYAKRAFELGGAEDPGVLEVLANALGANGEAQHGLRFLERLHALANEGEPRDVMAKRIQNFRVKHKLGDVWEFLDGLGNIIFESSNIEDIRKALENGSMAKNVQCRKNKIGGWQPIEQSLAVAHEPIAALYSKQTNPLLLYTVVGAVAGLTVGMLLSIARPGGFDNNVLLALTCVGTVILGGFIGAGTGMIRANASKKK